MVLDIEKYSACGQNHVRVQAVELVNPVALPTPAGAGTKWTHFFLCPTNQKQVLVRLVADQELQEPGDKQSAGPASAT